MKHVKLTVTREELSTLGCCAEGLDRAQAAGLLPAVISTNPKHNLDLALRLTEATSAEEVPGARDARRRRVGIADLVSGLSCGLLGDLVDEEEAIYTNASEPNGHWRASLKYDAYVVSQVLAMIADKIDLYRRGKLTPAG